MEILFGGLKNTIVFIIALSILIVVHEWGHFITAKKLGVHVQKFSLGFGKKIWSKIYNGTEYLICLLPLGGYVKMAGDERNRVTGKKDEFFSQPPGRRSLIVLNGPMVNFVFAYMCLVLVYMLGYPDIPAKVGDLIEGKPAQAAGLKRGDRILTVDGEKVYGWTDLQTKIQDSKFDKVNLTIMRGDETLAFSIDPQIDAQPNEFGQVKPVRQIGISPYGTVIGDIERNGPADNAGIRVGDEIVSVDGKPVGGWVDVHESISQSPNETIVMKVRRDGQVMTMAVASEAKTVEGEAGKEETRRFIGIGPEAKFSYYEFGFFESFGKGWEKLVEITVLTYKAIYFMIVGTMDAKESVTGPVGIFYIFTSAAERGLSPFLFILGVVSASLAIFNLLPIIPLDGGHLLLFGIEKLRGKELSAKTDEMITRIGFSFIILLALFVFYSDFARFGWIDFTVEKFQQIFQ